MTDALRFPAEAVAYLSQPAACDGAHVLVAMKAALDERAAAYGVAPRDYYVDSGRRDDATAYGHALLRLVRDARHGRFKVVVILGLSALAEDARMAAFALEALRQAGVFVLDLGERQARGCDRARSDVGGAR